MKIAVCDDDRQELAQICSFLEHYFADRKLQLSYKEYHNSFELASTARYEGFDLYLLDVLMPVLNGMELAKEIRSFDKAADIIFLTSSPEFAVDSYTVKAANYLVKPIAEGTFSKALDDIMIRRHEESEKSVIIKSTQGVHKIHLSGLVYVEAQNRKVIYHLKNGEHLISTERFSTVCNSLLDYPEFILPHRSLLVNMNYVRSITATDMHLHNKKVIPLAQRRVSEIRRQYLAFQMEEIP